MRASLAELLSAGRTLLADGATGTNYFERGLGAGDPPEFWNTDHPEKVRTLHQQFVDASDKGLQGGFFEKEVHRETQRFGNIAHVFSTYESRIKADGPTIARGINSIQAFWDGKRWWITNAIWDEERPDNPMPPEYSPKASTDHPASK